MQSRREDGETPWWVFVKNDARFAVYAARTSVMKKDQPMVTKRKETWPAEL